MEKLKRTCVCSHSFAQNIEQFPNSKLYRLSKLSKLGSHSGKTFTSSFFDVHETKSPKTSKQQQKINCCFQNKVFQNPQKSQIKQIQLKRKENKQPLEKCLNLWKVPIRTSLYYDEGLKKGKKLIEYTDDRILKFLTQPHRTRVLVLKEKVQRMQGRKK